MVDPLSYFSFQPGVTKAVVCVILSVGRKEMFYLTTHSTHFIYVRHMVKDHSDSERGNPLPPHGLLFPISSKGSFICVIPSCPG